MEKRDNIQKELTSLQK